MESDPAIKNGNKSQLIEQAEKRKSCEMKDEKWRMKMKVYFADKQTDICDCRVSFVTEKESLG